MRLRFSFHLVVNYLRENVAAFKVIVMQIVSKLVEKIHSIINIFDKVYIPILNMIKKKKMKINNEIYFEVYYILLKNYFL